jgi:hypothetical protein
MVSMVGGPLWFVTADLVLAYIPMAWCGGRMGIAVTRANTAARVTA